VYWDSGNTNERAAAKADAALVDRKISVA
jgi:hypothetical protein